LERGAEGSADFGGGASGGEGLVDVGLQLFVDFAIDA
jgi:hypothetical protein